MNDAGGRRRVLRIAGVAVAAGLAGCLGNGGGESGVGGGEADYGDWFDGVPDAGEEVDRTGEDRVTVAVGGEAGDDGDDGFDFVPTKLLVSPGTTVVWEWTGRGGQHTVTFEDRDWASEFASEAGHTYEKTLRQPGIYRYICEPHASLGMIGAVRVARE